jgi:glycosyltransferase involved in cell wall biosynthesis
MDKKVLIAVPALDMMPVQTAYSMINLKRDCPSRFSFIVRASCHDARNMLACEAIESNADYVLWIDSDMVFQDDLMIRLREALDSGWDMVAGLCFKRELPVSPVIYKSIDADTGKAVPYMDYPQNALFEIAGCGFGTVMMTTDVLRVVHDSYSDHMFTPFPKLSEDLSFSYRAKRLGVKIGCDSRINVGHVGLITYGEQMYRRPEV